MIEIWKERERERERESERYRETERERERDRHREKVRDMRRERNFSHVVKWQPFYPYKEIQENVILFFQVKLGGHHGWE